MKERVISALLKEEVRKINAKIVITSQANTNPVEVMIQAG